jgi:DNA modification methylase
MAITRTIQRKRKTRPMTEIAIPQAQTLNVADLKTDGKNPNRMSKEQHERLATSIKKYGFIVPIITNKDLLIADGEQRWTVAKSLGMKQVSVIRLPVEEVDRKLLRQVLNKLRGEHELLLDAEEFDSIIELGGKDDLQHLLNLSDSDLEQYLRELNPTAEDKFEPQSLDEVETGISKGDIIQLGTHRLICGDITEPLTLERLIGDNKIDCVFTDPPYNCNYSSKNEFLNNYDKGNRIQKPIENDNIDIEPLLLQTWTNIKPFMADYNAVYICGVSSSLHNLFDTLAKADYFIHQVLVWEKNNIVLGRQDYENQHEFIVYGWFGKHKFYGRNQRSVWHIDKPNKSDLHPTMKPLPLVMKAVLNSSQPNSNVLDMFGGSGSTLIVCEDTGRNCYMSEIDPRYCEIICQRWEKYTGQKRKKVKENDQPQTSQPT